MRQGSFDEGVPAEETAFSQMPNEGSNHDIVLFGVTLRFPLPSGV